ETRRPAQLRSQPIGGLWPRPGLSSRLLSNPIQTSLRFEVYVRRERATLRCTDVLLQVCATESAHNGRMDVRMGEQEAQQEGRPTFSLAAQLIQAGSLKLVRSACEQHREIVLPPSRDNSTSQGDHEARRSCLPDRRETMNRKCWRGGV